MPIGSFLTIIDVHSPLPKRFAKKVYYYIYGTRDLHTHIRWRAIKHFININANSVLDVGCGEGIISLELVLNYRNMKVTGIDISEKSISQANLIKEALRVGNVEFQKLNATEIFPFGANSFDMILLVDILEHIANPNEVIANVSRVLKPGGTLVISVPTPNYPRFFGYEFHKEIGHLRKGYLIDEIKQMLQVYGISVITYKYYTWFPASIVCALFYRYLRKHRIGTVVSPLLNLISYFDLLWPKRNHNFACSLVLKAKKGN